MTKNWQSFITIFKLKKLQERCIHINKRLVLKTLQWQCDKWCHMFYAHDPLKWEVNKYHILIIPSHVDIHDTHILPILSDESLYNMHSRY